MQVCVVEKWLPGNVSNFFLLREAEQLSQNITKNRCEQVHVFDFNLENPDGATAQKLQRRLFVLMEKQLSEAFRYVTE